MTQGIDFIKVAPGQSPYFCDWYACLVEATPDNIMEGLDEPLRLSEFKPVPGIPQYDQSVGLWSHRYRDRPVFELSYGGNQGAAPHLVAKGYVAHDAHAVLRRVFPSHRVSRMDVACDMVGEGLYEQISGVLLDMHRFEGLKTRTINHDVPEMGRTHYLGSRESVAMIRLYEKGKQERNQGQPFIEHHVRLELEVKPQKRPDKARWANVSLDDAWGAARWTKRLAEKVLSLDVQRIRRHPPMKRTDEETLQSVLQQHSRLIRRVGEDRVLELLHRMFSEGATGVDQDVRDHALN